MEIVADPTLAFGWRMSPLEQKTWYFIYRIKCKQNGKIYVGRTRQVKHRFAVHATSLRGGYHENKALQEDFNKYGDANFEIKIITKTADKHDRSEAYYIEHLHSYNPLYGYNNDAIARMLRRREANNATLNTI